MDDLISRKAAIAEIEEYIEEYSELEPETGYHNLKWCAMEEAKEVLSMLPAVDAVPVVHARWGIARFEKTYTGYTNAIITKEFIYHVCSACGKDVDGALFNYCPNCGAKMDGERRESE